jgi:hypothetical protein
MRKKNNWMNLLKPCKVGVDNDKRLTGWTSMINAVADKKPCEEEK